MMNLPAALFSIRCLIWETYRQSLASGIFWIMLAVSAVCIVFCLSVGFSPDTPVKLEGDVLPSKEIKDPEKAKIAGVEKVRGEMTLAFGAFKVPVSRDRTRSVRELQAQLAGFGVDALGLLLALIWTAGFLPAFLDPSAASVLLAKPVPRWSLLLGKYIGVLVFVFCQIVIFVGGTWLALGLRSGVWGGTYLLSIPLFLLHFAAFFSVSTFLAVSTRSTVSVVFGSIMFWIVCWVLNFSRHMSIAVPDLQQMSPILGGLLETGYWVLPKPTDLCQVLFDALGAGDFFGRLVEYRKVEELGRYSPELSVLTSLGFAVVVLAAAGWEFVTQDY
jgi:hypothetical protein